MTEQQANPFEALKSQIASDPGYAWAWHCNFAMPIMDATGVSHSVANEAGAHLMSFLFDYDMTTHPNYEGKKSGAQMYHEMRIEVEGQEDVPQPIGEHE